MMRVSEAYSEISGILKKGGVENPSFEAECILESFLGADRIKRINHPELEIDFEQVSHIIEKRLSGIPLQYLIGKWDFYGFEFEVGDGVLIPRPETEILVEKCVELLKSVRNPVVFDLCAGTGCIGLSVARTVPGSDVFLFEKSKRAFSFLEKNARGITNAHIVNADIFQTDLSGYKQPDMIISNPPYIKTSEIPSLQREVLFEPSMALDGGEDGLDFYRVICNRWLPELKKGGFVAVECGEEQSAEIEKMFSELCKKTFCVKDYNGTERIVIGEK